MFAATESAVLKKSPFKHHEAIAKELTEDLQRVRVSGDPLESKIVQAKVDSLCSWLCTTPDYIAYRVNTRATNTDEVRRFIVENYLRPALPREMGILQLQEMVIVDSWNDELELDLKKYPNEVTVDSACGSAVLRGAHVFGPGILSMSQGSEVGSVVSVFADATGSCKKGAKFYNDPSKVFVGNGTVLQTRKDLFGEGACPSGVAIRMSDARSRLPQLSDSSVVLGHAILQNPPSIICSRILDPQPGERVLDMCAAPGNKTTHLSALMNGEGRLVALEKNKSKIDRLRANCRAFACENVSIHCFDSTRAARGADDFGTEDEPPFPEESFHRVLLDGPCSALGQRPQILNRITPKELRSYVPLQRKLFAAAVKLLKSGGVLVYSTCTVTVAENEGIVAWALKNFPNLKLSSVRDILGSMDLDERHRGSRGYSIDGLDDSQSEHLLRFGPDSDTVGFFIARFVKI